MPSGPRSRSPGRRSPARRAAAQRLLLYLGALLVAIDVLRSAASPRAVEPALASAGSRRDRLRPRGPAAARHLRPRRVARRRRAARAADHLLEREGALAAVGLVLSRGSRATLAAAGVRAAAAAAVAPLGAGVYLSSRAVRSPSPLLGLVVLVARRRRARSSGRRARRGRRRRRALAAASCRASPRWRALGARERDGRSRSAPVVLAGLAAR